jgi:hypothetical protein
MPSNRAARVKTLLDKYDACPLECDGFTRVAHSVLTRANVPHHVFIGTVTFRGVLVPLHYWIELPDGTVVDYRLRMWVGDDAPHGVFPPDDRCDYHGTRIHLSTPQFLIDILTGGV